MSVLLGKPASLPESGGPVCGVGRALSSSPSFVSDLLSKLSHRPPLPQFLHRCRKGLGSPASNFPSQLRVFGLQESDSPSSLFSPQAAPSPRAFCVPRIILTECTPNPPSPPEARPEEVGPRTTPTPRPRTLAGSGRGCDGAWALPEVVAKASQPRSPLAPEKEGTALKRWGIESCSPMEGGAGAPCPWGPALDGTQELSIADTQPEKTPEDTRQDAQAGSGEPRGQPTAGLGCTVRGAPTQRMDSLEETLRELEAALSQMGTALAVGPPGRPPPLSPGPQVAASSPSLSSCLHALISWSSELEGVGGCRSITPAPSSHWPFLSSHQPPGSPVPGGVCRQNPGRLGSRPTQGSAQATLAGTRFSPLCSVSINQQIKFSPPFPSPCSLPPLLSDSLCLCCFSVCASEPPASSWVGWYLGWFRGAGLVHL